MDAPEVRKVSTAEVFGYSFYAFCMFLGQITFGFLNLYYPIIGMDVSLLATALLVGRIADFFVSLTAGGIIEKINLKIGGGKYRPWLFVGQFAVYAGMVIMFSDPLPGSNVMHFVTATVGVLVWQTGSTFIMIANYGFIPQMAGADPQGRTRLTTWAYRMATAGTIVTSAINAYCLQWISMVVPEPLNYTVMAATFGLFYFVGIAFVRVATKPYDVREEGPGAANNVAIRDMIRAVTTNSQLLVYLSAQTIIYIGGSAAGALMIYYWRIIVPFTHNLDIISVFPPLYTIGNTTRTICSFIFAIFVPLITMRIGKKRSMWVHTLVATGVNICNFFLASENWMLYVGLTLVTTFTNALYAGVGVNYALDCAEYGLWKTGEDHRLVIMSMQNMPQKIGAIIGGFNLYALAAIGFDSVLFQQSAAEGVLPVFATDEFVNGFVALMFLIPAACNFIAFLLMRFVYKISDEDAAMYAKENQERKEAAQAAAAE